MHPRGYSLVEILVVLAVLAILSIGAVPHLRAYSVQAHLIGAGQFFRTEFNHARSIAVRSGANTAIRFEGSAQTGYRYSTYADGNHNGVLSEDIARGIDTLVAGPHPVGAGYVDVKAAILPGTPSIPPEHEPLDPADPIRFGRSNMISFSPNGTATPGTLYLAGPYQQAAIRVNGMTSRVRLLFFRGGQWKVE